MDIGFIGLGEMGSAMAINALKAGHTVRVWNRSRDKTCAMAEQGAAVVDTSEQAFFGDAAFSMLADDNALRSVPVDGTLLHAPKGLVHVNMATISVALAVELAELYKQHGVAYVAAPVLGRPDVAAAGKLNILAAGGCRHRPRAAGVRCARPEDLARRPRSATRECVQTRGELHAGIGDRGLRRGGDARERPWHAGANAARRDHEFALSRAGVCIRGYGKMISERRYKPRCSRRGLKDVRLAIAAGDGVNVPLPVASVVRDNFVDALAHDDGEKDFAVLGQLAARRAGQ